MRRYRTDPSQPWPGSPRGARGRLPPNPDAYTPRTVTDRGKLDHVLAAIRHDRYATCPGGLEEYSSGVSAATLDRLQRPVVMVNVWGTSHRIDAPRMPELERTHETSPVLDS
jgi:DNA-binding IclR family transcriptional regulator